MKILVSLQGNYGERILANLKTHGPRDWQITRIRLPRNLPPVIDEPGEFIPQKVPEADLLLFLSESPEASQLIPDVALSAAAKGVIAPVDHASWLPPGLGRQVKEALDKLGIDSVFPKTFCTLTRKAYGYGDAAQPYANSTISEFATYFGRPKLAVNVDPETRLLTAVTVSRCSPCGSTYHAARKIVGYSVDEAIPAAGLICMQYPCLASMEMEQIDRHLYNTLMHLSGQIFNDELAPHLKAFCRDI
jgi:thymidylate synthase